MNIGELTKELSGAGTPLVLTAGDSKLQELGGWLASLPGKSVRLTGSVEIQLDSTAQTLTISGTTGDAWPVQGVPGLTLTLTQMAITIDVQSGSPVIGAVAQASVSGLTSDPIAGTVTAQPPLSSGQVPWLLALTADAPGVTVHGLVALAGIELPYEIPPDLDVLTSALTLDKADFAVTFHPNTTYDALYAFGLEAPSFKWTAVEGVFAIDGVRVVVQAKSSSIAVTLVTTLEIGGVALDLGVGLSPGSVWTATLTPAQGAKAFPSLDQIVTWMAGTGPSQSGSVSSALGALPHVDVSGFDAAIEAVAVTFDAQTKTLTDLTVDSQIDFAGMPLDVRVTLPHLQLDAILVAGTPPIPLATVLATFGSWASDLPVETTIETVRFSASPADERYAVTLVLTDGATAGPSLALDEITVDVAYSAAGLDGQIDCVLALWDVAHIDLSAAYSTQDGWVFTGRTPDGDPIQAGGLLTRLGTAFGVSNPPQPLATLTIDSVRVDYATGTKAFRFGCIGDFTAYDTPIEIEPAVSVEPVDAKDLAKGYKHTYGGTVVAGGIAFELAMSSDPQSSAIAASVISPGAPIAIDLDRLVSSISSTLGALVPSGLSIGLKNAKLVSVTGGTKGRRVAAGIDLAASFSLSDLPLIGARLGSDDVAVQDLQILFASDQLTTGATGDVAEINPLLPAEVQLPGAGVAAGTSLSATIVLGSGNPEALSLPFGSPPTVDAVALGDAPAAPSPPAPAPPAAPIAQWWPVQRQLGPVHFQRFGLLYDSGALFFAIDAAIQSGPLTLSLQGLGLGSPLSSFEPEMRLDGVGIEYSQPPLEIAGAVMRVEPPPAGTRYQFDGTLTIATTGFSLAAIGSYAVLEDGEPSLFVFAQLEKALGGPPAFFVTGLMAGFGFNRTLAIPAQDEMTAFPLLTLNQPPTAGGPPVAQDPSAVLGVLEGRVAGPDGTKKQWVAPEPGSYWIGVGVEFTSFELVKSRAVLVAELGDELVLALVGLSTIQLPQEGSPYAYAELELEAVLKPSVGFFGLTAVLSPNSYVLTPDCHLTGGFAFYVWFAPSDNAGQFVLTLGGYHPAFKPPDYFPQVPRLGFNWAVSDSVSVGGDAYFALTTGCVMAGGRLQVLFHDGDLQAWFDMSADVLISWRPFFFEAQISVDIGVSCRISLLFCHVTISLSLGATVDLWGPPTGGTANVHLWCVSFSVSFGSQGGSTETDPIAWDKFAKLLPESASVLRLVPTGALYKTQDASTATSSGGKTWVVRATGFSFDTLSAVPASHLCYGDVPKGGSATDGAIHTGDAVSIRPMNLPSTTAVHRLAIRAGDPAATPMTASDPAATPRTASEWSVSAKKRNMPEALWGTPPTPFTQTPQPGANPVPNQMVGFSVAALPPKLGATAGVFVMSELANYPLPSGTGPLDAGAAPSPDYVPAADATSVSSIKKIADMAPTRSGLIGALGSAYDGPDDPMTTMQQKAEALFSDAPMVEA